MDAVMAENLAKIYRGGVWGIRNVSFNAKTSSITVLLGPNGAGKTTTVSILSTLLKPTKGRASVLGYDIVRDTWKIRERIALCPQDIAVDVNWSPLEAVKGYLIARGWGIRDATREARKWLEELELWDIRNRPVARLSGGQRKRVAVAMVLASNADVIFLDEPTSGLDVEGKYRVWKALRAVIKDGATILLTTHDMKEAEIIGDKIVLISSGVVIAEGSVEELLSKVPFKYKVVAKNVKYIPDGMSSKAISLEDRLILYAETRSEAMELMSMLDAENIIVGEVGLEDAYIYLVERRR